MNNLIQKRKKISDWLRNAEEAEIDALLETIMDQGQVVYPKDVIHELDIRWENYISGKSPTISLPELSEKLANRQKNSSI